MQSKRWAAVVAVGTLVVLTIGPVGAQDWLEDPVRIVALSNRADLVSGGDVLLEVVLPARAADGGFTATIGERDVTQAFGVRDGGRVLGLVDGLTLGTNTVTVTLPDGSGATLEVTNHPLGGPIFAGAQVQPWICSTEAQDLGPPLDEKCTAPPEISYQYMPEGGDSFQPYDPANPPSEVATTMTDSGQTVPFIIRVEKGSMDRGIYGIAALYDPANPVPWAQDWWDHKVVTSFGGDCDAEFQQTGSGVSLNATQLGRGFAQISQGLFTLGSNCNEIVAAEALVMLRERLIEVYGDIRYVLSTGCSGGSMMQLTIANSYPGLLDGITPTCTYPDQWTTWNETIDCSLMQRYWLNEPTGVALWPAEQQKADASGHLSNSTCVLWEATYDNVVVDPGECAPNDQEWEYHAENNPEGTRCTLADYQIAVYGPRPESEWGPVEQQIGRGFANRPLDNVGVRYGLRALQNGQITTEQFVDLNEMVGGYDIDFNHVPERMEANPIALDRHYRAGRVTQGHNLGQVAIVDGPAGIANAPLLDNSEFHTSFRGYMLRDRLTNSRGHDENHIIARGGTPSVTDLLDRWLSAVDADAAEGTREDKIVRNRPEDATDHCYLGGARSDDQAACAAAWPYYADPRIAAGGPFTDHIMKCQLKPHSRNSNDYRFYGIVLTDPQWERLEATFPDGVCDYTRPGVGEQPAVTWQTYADGAGMGRPLGDPPVSVPFGPEGAAAVLVTRHGGIDRLETAVEVSGLGVDAADAVVVARADDYADALAGAPLAVHLRAPLLLSSRDALSSAAADEVRRLGASHAVLLGGEAALSSQVATDLEDLGLVVRRVGGADRFATAAAIAGEMPVASEVLVARGDGFADALAASALGAATRTAVLLAQPDALPAATAAALNEGVAVTIVGGEAAIGPEVAAELDAAAGDVRRLAGATRYATSAAVADAALARGAGASVIWVATGRNFPDALVAGAAAARDGGVLLLVDGSDLAGSPETRDWLVAYATDIRQVRIAGGTDAVSAQVEQALAEVFSSQEASAP